VLQAVLVPLILAVFVSSMLVRSDTVAVSSLLIPFSCILRWGVLAGWYRYTENDRVK
jgi:hypothetical protein